MILPLLLAMSSTSSLPDHLKKRLMALNDRRITEDGVIIIKAQQFRSLDQNKADAVQRLRLLIARAVYQEAEYIFLDEATTALDTFNEMLIMEELEETFARQTVVLVAHRLNTVRNADHIIVLESGEVVEEGSHDELYYSRGAYYQLLRNQLELGA